MLENKRIIKKSNYFLLSVLILLNNLMLIRIIFTFSFHRIITHETIWSFFLSSFYLISIFISDSYLYLFNSTKFEKFNDYIRNSFSIIAYSYCYSITIEFWAILFIGLTFGKNPFSEKKPFSFKLFLEALYLHFGITVIMLIDLILTKRGICKKNNKIILIINVIYFSYSIIVILAKYVFFMPAYPL